MGITLGDRAIGLDEPPFVISEMSGNHNGSLERALQITRAAAESGVHALKLQTYTADTLTLDVHADDFLITDESNLWHGNSLYQLYKKSYTPWEWHEPIMDLARQLGLFCFSAPFDESAVEFLESLDCPAYKIASFENIHLPLVEKVASTGKPVIISTGMASITELGEVVDVAVKHGCEQLILLKCTSAYPASPSNSNIMTIPHMRQLFQCEVGLSDHTLGLGVAAAAVAQGASVIEKHFTLSRADGGVDSAFSMEPVEMQNLVLETDRAWRSLGTVTYGPTDPETNSTIFRRSLYISKDVKKGETLDRTNVRVIRPGFGLLPKYLDLVIGRSARRDLMRGEKLLWEDIS